MIDPKIDDVYPVTVHPLRRALALLWLVPRREIARRTLHQPKLRRVGDLTLYVAPDVFDPVLFRTGAYFCEFLKARLSRADGNAAMTVLDISTGSGIQGLTAASAGFQVTAVDVNPNAVRCARINTLINGLENTMQCLESDLYTAIADKRFDRVICSLPNYRGAPGAAGLDLAWRSPDVIERFASGLAAHLKPEGYAYVLLSTDGDQAGMLTALKRAGFAASVAHRKHFGNEIMTVYEVTRADR